MSSTVLDDLQLQGVLMKFCKSHLCRMPDSTGVRPITEPVYTHICMRILSMSLLPDDMLA